MKAKVLLFLGSLFTTTLSHSQTIIRITINSTTDAQVVITNAGTAATDLKDADFSDGNGKLHIINTTTDNSFTLTFIDKDNKPIFRIPTSSIPSKANNVNGTKDYNISATGVLNPAEANGILVKGMGITMKSTDLQSDKIILLPAKTTPPKKGKPVKDNKLYQYVEREIGSKGYTYVASQNIIIDDRGVIHIYLDENGNPIYSYYPVTAKENIDKFQFHIISTTNAGYVVESDAELNPVEISEEVKTNVASTQSDAQGQPARYNVFNSPTFGPYTTSFPFTITKTANGSSDVMVDKSIKLLKTSRISVGTAVVATWLNNPENIAMFVKPNGDTTLIADDKDTRGYLSLFLTFHFIPRNLNIQPRNFSERLGVSVGTNLTDKSFSNFFLGLNVEITNGLFFNVGGHFGQVNYAVGHDRFDFGSERFSGTLETRKKWQLGGPYIAVNIDAALFAKVFTNILGANSGGQH